MRGWITPIIGIAIAPTTMPWIAPISNPVAALVESKAWNSSV